MSGPLMDQPQNAELHRAAAAAFGLPLPGAELVLPPDSESIRELPEQFTRVALALPGGDASIHGRSALLLLDPSEQQAYVSRPGLTVPMTAERAEVVERLRERYARSAAAFAAAGVEADAAETLRAAGVDAQQVWQLLDIVSITTVADAEAYSGRSLQSWAEQGWPLGAVERPWQLFAGRRSDRSQCWSAVAAARLADAGISGRRAYELRRAGHTTPEEAIRIDATQQAPAAVAAQQLLAAAEDGAPAGLAEALADAREFDLHDVAESDPEGERADIPDDERSRAGITVGLERYRFRGPHQAVLGVLWRVTTTVVTVGEDADAEDTHQVWCDETEARRAFARAVRTAPETLQDALERMRAAADDEHDEHDEHDEEY